MPEISPLTFFRFASDHSALLIDIFYRSAGMNDAEIRDLVIRHQKPSDPSPHRVIDQLEKLGILEAVPGATATFEMTRPVSSLLAYLLRRHRLTSVEVIQAYLSDLEHLSAELSGALEHKKSQVALRILDEMAEVMERIRQDSRSNRDGIIGEAMRIKANREKRSVRERFEIINRLWKRYLEPLRDLIDVRKAMDAALDRLEVLFRDGGARFATDRAMAREFAAVSARLLRLRRDARTDYHESLAELGPLYEALRKDSALARGASHALEILGRKGIMALGITEAIALPVWRTEGLLFNKALIAFFQGIKGYEPKAAPALADPPDARDTEGVIDQETLRKEIMSSLPMDDLLSWLIQHYSEYSAPQILRAYGRALCLKGISFETEGGENTYVLGSFLVRAFPKAAGPGSEKRDEDRDESTRL